ncbi:MAG: UDP-3-O-acyl-N-acetylglucosamine deacetylase [Myxococcota bacterium]
MAKAVRCHGIGLHSGKTIALEIVPAPVDHGVTFVRTDVLHHETLAASVHRVVDTTMATTLGVGVNGSRVTVGTVEHLLAALRALGIDNVLVRLDGPEVPVLDGSAAEFC